MNEIMEISATSEQDASTDTKKIVDDIKSLLARIEDAVPLISLALTTSGANLSASLPSTVSPSRLLQASSALQAADMRFDALPMQEVQVGPSFSLKLYTIFEGHSRRANDPNISNITWQETYAKCILEVVRMPMSADVEHETNEDDLHYLYHFRVTENLDDGRFHEEFEEASPRKDSHGFIRGASRDIPVHNVARLFFSASGRLLNIEEARTPVLVLKINHNLKGPSALVHAIYAGQTGNEQDRDDSRDTDYDQTAPDDLEWLALELWQDEDEDLSEDEVDAASIASAGADNNRPSAELNKESTEDSDEDDLAMNLQVLSLSEGKTISPRTKVSESNLATLSLLEYILRLSALQTSEQQSLLSVTDERISLFLRDEAGQSRTRPQEAEAVRRPSDERYGTPASSIYFDEFVPGTQRRSNRKTVSGSGSGSSKPVTPNSASSSPALWHSSSATTRHLSTPVQTHRPAAPIRHDVPGTAGSRRWPVLAHNNNINKNNNNANPRHNNNVRPIHHSSPGARALAQVADAESPLTQLKTRRREVSTDAGAGAGAETATTTTNTKVSVPVPVSPTNLFQTSDDLQAKTNNGFASRLRHVHTDVHTNKDKDEVVRSGGSGGGVEKASTGGVSEGGGTRDVTAGENGGGG